MAHTYKYAIIQLVPFSHREEVFNAGVVVVRGDVLDVRFNAAPQLLAYFGISYGSLDWIASSLTERDNPDAPLSERFASFAAVPGVRLSEVGWFIAEDELQYTARLTEISEEYVSKPTISRHKKAVTSVASDLRRRFKGYGLFGSRAGDISRHKIVAGIPVGPSGKLQLDFLLKNSFYHATETLDFRRSQEVGVSELKNAALVNVTFQHTRESLGEETRCYLVYAANALTERAVKPAMDIAQRDVTETFNVESEEDRRRYFDIMLAAAGTNGLPLQHS